MVLFPAVYLLHGKGGSPAGSVSKLEALLRPRFPSIEFVRPLLPHNNPTRPAEDSVGYLESLGLPESALVVGISLGGLVAAKLQEASRPDLHVICISSPTWADGVKVRLRMENRVAIYSSNDDVIADRTKEWPELARAIDLPWLSHDTDKHASAVTSLISEYIIGGDFNTTICKL